MGRGRRSGAEREERETGGFVEIIYARKEWMKNGCIYIIYKYSNLINLNILIYILYFIQSAFSPYWTHKGARVVYTLRGHL